MKIVLEDFSEGDGYYKVDLAYLTKEQVEEIEALVSKWKPTDEDIKACIGMCLTDANEQRFEAYGTTFEDCLTWLEKQGQTFSILSNSSNTGKKWTEKDEKMLLFIQKKLTSEVDDWLNSLKQRMEE